MGDKVFINVALYKQVMRFSGKGKVTLRFIITIEVLEKIEKITYRPTLLMRMEYIYNVFHILLLCRLVNDPSHVLNTEKVKIKDEMVYEKCPVQILDIN